MSKVTFNVSSRAARLIGRENVSSATGALIELVKNCHDADASRAIIIFDNKYEEIPSFLSEPEYIFHKKKFQELDKIYSSEKKIKTNVAKDLIEEFSQYLRGFNSIYVIDNGHGMNEKTVIDYWMNIGTDNKQFSPKSPKGRIRSGAKGIGRFALDRLGSFCTMYSFDSTGNGIEWKVDWEDFEKPSQKINEVTADLNKISDSSLYERVAEFTLEHMSNELQDCLEKSIKTSGTVLKVSGLRDWWPKDELSKAFVSLDTLIPPNFQETFEVFFYELGSNDYGSVKSQMAEEYDYKLEVIYEGVRKINVNLYRNELSFENLPEKLFKSEEFSTYPYRKIDFKKKCVSFTYSLDDLFQNSQLDFSLFEKIGPLKFYFLFMKKSEQSDFREFYRSVDFAKRSKWLSILGGIKIYRDNFKVRPYGEPGGVSFDWLDLGGRQARSPAGVTSKGWRVAPYQIAGAVHISRVHNTELQDKSSREGLVENDTFLAFKKLIERFIEIFEEDRVKIMRGIKDSGTPSNDTPKSDPKKFEKFLNDLKSGKKTTKENSNQLKQLVNAYESQQTQIKDLNDENKLLTSLASTGLTVSAYAHELLNLQSNVLLTSENLEKRIQDNFKNLTTDIPAFKDPRILVKSVIDYNKRVDSWLLLCIQTIKKEKRTRSRFSIEEYLEKYEKVWEETLAREAITLKSVIHPGVQKLKMFQIDLDSIFNNLIVNSVHAYRVEKIKRKDKQIKLEIMVDASDENLIIKYADSGPGLDKKIKDPRDILKPFFTTRIDKFGVKTGTGLGMWIVKKIVDEYKGSIQINKPNNGFSVNIVIPLDMIV